jgi:predicted HD phosphohydrolase
MLTRLEGITDGFATNQLVHSLQTATLAEQAGADPEMIVASLCHDIGKVISVFGHPDIAAAILRPYVRDDVYQVIRVHQDFQGRHYYQHFGGDTNLRERHRDQPWFDSRQVFADEWTRSPSIPTRITTARSLAMVREAFARPVNNHAEAGYGGGGRAPVREHLVGRSSQSPLVTRARSIFAARSRPVTRRADTTAGAP